MSSDRQVLLAARQAGAKALSSQAFIGQVDQGEQSDGSDKKAPELGPGELNEWLSLFGTGDEDEQEQAN